MAGSDPGILTPLIGCIVGLAFYAYFAMCIMIMARKSNTENGWMAWIPILNVVLLIQIGRKPLWWIVLLLIPLVNVVVAILIWMAVAEVRGKPAWAGILMIIPLVNFVVPAWLASD